MCHARGESDFLANILVQIHPETRTHHALDTSTLYFSSQTFARLLQPTYTTNRLLCYVIGKYEKGRAPIRHIIHLRPSRVQNAVWSNSWLPWEESARFVSFPVQIPKASHHRCAWHPQRQLAQLRTTCPADKKIWMKIYAHIYKHRTNDHGKERIVWQGLQSQLNTNW